MGILSKLIRFIFATPCIKCGANAVMHSHETILDGGACIQVYTCRECGEEYV